MSLGVVGGIPKGRLLFCDVVGVLGCCWLLVDVVGCCWMLLDVVGWC